jgi:MFS family permease
MWGTLTLMLAGASSLSHAMFLRAFNGVALGMVTPVMQSVIVDVASPEDRGKLFGLALFCNSLGQTVCSLLATQMSTRMIWSTAGWRVAFLAVAVLSLTLATTLSFFMVEAPRRVRTSDISIKEELQMFGKYWQVSSFKVIVFQGVFGMVPANVLVFLIMYFQYVGFSNAHAAMFFMAYTFCHGAGAFLGGFIGDFLARLSPDHGRAVTAQISVISGLPLVWAVTHGLRRSTENAPWYALCLICLGLFSSWCGAGVNAPLLSEVVSRQHVARIYAWNIALQQSFALTLGATGTAFLAQRVFGYESTSQKLKDMLPVTRESNAAALGEAMAWLTVVPWMACFLFYTSLHFVYPTDKRRASEQHELPTEQARVAF